MGNSARSKTVFLFICLKQPASIEYQEEGTITTPFDMRVQNEIDRFHLVKDAVLHLPQLGNRGAYLVQQMNDKLVEHKNYIHEVGQDMPEILDWKWHI